MTSPRCTRRPPAERRPTEVDAKKGVTRLRRGVARSGGGRRSRGRKAGGGKRDVAIPPHLIPAVKAHLAEHVAVGPDALVFPAAAVSGVPGALNR